MLLNVLDGGVVRQFLQQRFDVFFSGIHKLRTKHIIAGPVSRINKLSLAQTQPVVHYLPDLNPKPNATDNPIPASDWLFASHL